tara:strand:+ start:5245 stop:6435 length:1191 start_codon:yes stop_codon:yes gene_type:complete
LYLLFISHFQTKTKKTRTILNRLTYLTYQVFPSQKANSIQTMRMLENLSKNDIEVNLCYPRRGDLDFRKETIEKFYDIESKFKITQLAHKLPFGYFNYFEKINFIVSSFIWSFYSVKKIMKTVSNNEIIMTRTHWILFFLSKYKNLIIFECHKFSKINNYIFKRLRKKENILIVFSNKNLKDSFLLSSTLEKKAIILESSFEDRLFKDPKTYSNKKKNKIVFVGHLLRFNKTRDLEFIIDSFKGKELENFELTIIGGPNKAANDLKKTASKNVRILGHISNKEAIKEMESADIGILINEKDEHSEMHTSPIKYFEYLRSGLKILAVDFEAHKNLPLKENLYFFENKNLNSFKDNLIKVSKKNFKENTELDKFSYSHRVSKLINHIARLEGLEPPTL